MKNNDLKEINPIYIYEASYSSDSDDEISLVDLAMVLVRHKRMIAVITTFITALGVAAALSTPKKYTYTTSIEIGSQILGGKVKFFESPQTLLAKLQHGFIPKTLKEHRQSSQKDLQKYNIKVSVPKNSEIIVMEIKGTENNADLMTRLLQNVTTKAVQDHKRIYDAVKENVIALKEQAKNELNSLGKEVDNQEEKRLLLKGEIEVHESELANLRNTREILPPMKSIEPTGTSRKLIVIIATFAGIFLAVFAAFFAEFIAKVKEKTQTGSQ